MNSQLFIRIILLIIIFFSSSLIRTVYSAYTYIGNITSYTQDGSTITFTCGTAKVKVFIYTDDLIRIRLAPTGTFNPEEPWVVQKYNWTYIPYTFTDSGTYYQIGTNKLVIRINKSPFIVSFYDKNMNLLNKDHNTYRMGWDGSSVRCDKDMQTNDKFYGFGERFGAPANKRGKTIPMDTSDAYHTTVDDYTYCSIPFFMSPVGYGIYFHNSGKAYFRLGTDASDRYSFESPTEDMDYYFFYGPDFKSILIRYTELTGRPKLPPLWTFGFGMIHNNGESETKSIADQFRSNDFPGDGIGMDDLWKDCNGNFMWHWKDCIEAPSDCNWGYYPSPVTMLDYVKQRHFKTWVWIVPSILDGTTCGNNQEDGIANNYFVKRPDGTTDYPISPWYGTGYYVDFTKPAAKTWYKELTKNVRTTPYHPAPYTNVPAQPDVFKTDDGEYMPSDARVSIGWFGQAGSYNTGAEFDNIYPMLYNNAVCDATRERIGRGFTLYRAGGPGSQRSPTIWGGDQNSTFQAMQCAMNAQISISLSGISFWNHDIGGCDDARPSDELYTRWVAEYGMFLPQPFVNDWRNNQRQPWDYGTTVQANVRKYLHLHYRLIPYIYKYAYEATQNGLPMLRPLILEYVNDPNTHNRDYDYLYGEYFLVAPVYTSGQTTRSIYLPQGKWTNYWTEERFTGPQTINFSAPVGTLPLLVKGGAIIPMWPEMHWVMELEPNPITLDIFPDGTSEFVMYEDDGTSADWELGAYATTRFECIENANSITVNIGARTGSYTGMPTSRYYRLQVHHIANTPAEVRRDSTILTKYNSSSELDAASEGWYYDTTKKIVYVKPSQSISGAFQIGINMVQAGPPTKVVLYALPNTLYANGSSTSTVTAEIQDTNGILVTNSNAQIIFSLSGSAGGTLIGTNPVNANGGIARITYRSGTSSGTATITGTSSGLTQGQTNITLTLVNPPNPPTNLRCNNQINPMGLQVFTPDLSWTFSDPDQGSTQSAYKILVSSVQSLLNSNIGTTWNTNKINSSSNIVTYSGSTLQTGLTYYWKVQTWDNTDTQGPYSTVATFSMSQTQIQNNPPYAPINLKCMGQTNPKGISDVTPDLSWTFSDPDTGDTQSAFRLLVANSLSNINNNTGNMLDTNKIVSVQTTYTYNGLPLQNNSTYYWKIMTWDSFNTSGPYSSVASFTMPAGGVQTPIIWVSTTVLDFGLIGPLESRMLELDIRNTGIGWLTGTLSTDEEWIIIEPTKFEIDGSNPDMIARIAITVDNSILSQIEGEYHGTITINSNAGNANIVLVDVIVTATCVLVKPNPYNPNKGLLTFFGSGIVPGETKIKIYTLSGELVKQLSSEAGKEFVWDGKTDNNEPVSSGIYLYTYESPKEKGIGKFTVIY